MVVDVGRKPFATGFGGDKGGKGGYYATGFWENRSDNAIYP